MEYHALISIVVIVLTFVGYVPYIFDILKGKTRPHALTWFSVSLSAVIAYGLQVSGGAGVGSVPMLVITVICIIVFLLSLWRGTKEVTKGDVFLILISLIAFFLWIVVRQPVISVFLITTSEILAFAPTMRKSWKDPYSETLSLYEVSMVRHGLSIFALERINILTALYPAAWTLTNVVISSILIFRRHRNTRK